MAWMLALAVGAAPLPLSSRSIVVPAIFVNATDTAVVVRFETLRPIGGDGRRVLCEHIRQSPRTTPDVVSGWTWDDAKWSPASSVKFDVDTCVTELKVDARTSAWVHTNSMCDDYEQYLRRNPAIPPPFESFQVISSIRPVLLKGWDTAKVFERSWDACIYRFD